MNGQLSWCTWMKPVAVIDQTIVADLFSGHPGVATGLECRVPELVRRAFGVEFSLVDGRTGEVVQRSDSQPEADWAFFDALCREVARRGRPELIQEEEPLAVLALPLRGNGEHGNVAVGVFVTRRSAAEEEWRRAARTLGMDPQETIAWAGRQVPWSPEALIRVGFLVVEQSMLLERINRLEQENESVLARMAATYEEISLLHRLTQHLKISESDEDLARVALEWLYEVLPAEGLAAQLLPVMERDNSLTSNARWTSKLLASGRSPLDGDGFNRLVQHVNPPKNGRPVVINGGVTSRADWPFPEIRQLILVPLTESKNLFGWLAAFNHAADGEFRSVEASLLSSVAAILGIHSGNIELYRQRSELLAGVVRALTSAIEAKDRYTCGHSDRVARVALRLAQEMGYDGKTLETIYLSGLLHDIGKIGINDAVLRKPESLTDAEYEHIKTHVAIGHKILRDLKRLDDVLPVVLHHHEAWDGEGYPSRLPGTEIPLPARIVAVADSFDAMSSDRPYRKGMPDGKIDEIFRAGAGRQWDPDVVAALFRARDDIRRIAREDRPPADFLSAVHGPLGLRP